jgi:hypothetical protein
MLLGRNTSEDIPVETGFQTNPEKGMVVSSAELSKREKRIAAICENATARTQYDQ